MAASSSLFLALPASIRYPAIHGRLDSQHTVPGTAATRKVQLFSMQPNHLSDHAMCLTYIQATSSPPSTSPQLTILCQGLFPIIEPVPPLSVGVAPRPFEEVSQGDQPVLPCKHAHTGTLTLQDRTEHMRTIEERGKLVSCVMQVCQQ